MCIYFYNSNNYILKNEVISSIQQNLNQIEINLNDRLKAIINISDILFSNQNVQRIVSRSKESVTWNQQYEDYLAINKLIDNFALNNKDIKKIRFYIQDYFIYSRQNINFQEISLLKNTDSYQKIKERNGQIYWEPTRKYEYIDDDTHNIFSVCRLIKNFNDIYDDNVGVLSIDVCEEVLGEVLGRFNHVKNNQIYLINENGLIVSSKNKELLSSDFYKHIAIDKGILNNEITEVKIDNKLVLIIKKAMPLNNWTIFVLVPVKEVISKNSPLLRKGLLFIVLQVVIAFVVVASFFNSINKRIRVINSHMSQVSNYESIPQLQISNNDEISQLKKNFNSMIETIKQMILDISVTNKKKREADIKALQSQINPHFLYNTLDSVSWMAISQNALNVSKWITKLARFLRLTLSKGQHTVLIKQELEHVNLYLEIQKNIACNELKWQFNIQEDILNLPVIKFILQPIVENSIVHGFLEREDKSGSITITGYKENNYIHILITDNGIGIPQDKLISICNNLNKGDFSSNYGLANVNERLKLNYGEEYGLTIESKQGEGTKISFMYPVC